MMHFIPRASLLLLLVGCCSAQFNSAVKKGDLEDKDIDEASGIAVSRRHHGVMYTHNDKGDKSRLFAVDIDDGETLAEITVKHVANYDWEDLAYGPCHDNCKTHTCSNSVTPSRYCIYIGDIGDHSGDGARNNIYMIREPDHIKDQDVSVVDTLEFSWPEKDSETLMIDPTGQLYVISKVDNGGAKMAALPDNAWGGHRVALDMTKAAACRVVSSHHDPLGGDISPDGKEMVLVFQDGVYYYDVPDGDFLTAMATTYPARVQNYHNVDDTEAIAWDPHGLGFYTLAEGEEETIYYYSKSSSPNVGK